MRKYVQPAQRGVLARAVAVVGDVNVLRVALCKPRLLLGKRRAQARHCIVHTVRVKADHVHISFDDDDILYRLAL
ncbi:hypothetical protein SDC9_186978 [bioreactor metagenome]|uniref:Uncharacterized protein n=1 Tax=bioreactor metagenome TaxID=1076179 RepID=A0A645HL23_9ZZZZ